MPDLPAGRELDARVALALRERRACSLCDAEGCTFCGQSVPPPYSTDIVHAWRVVERLRGQGWRMYLAEVGQAYWPWDCRLFGPREQRVIAFAPTVPHAISLAALDALGNADEP